MFAVTKKGLPISPASRYQRTLCRPDARKVSGAQPTMTPFCAARASTSRAWATLGAKGFSLNRCFPAAMICLSSATWNWGGVRFSTMSISASPSRSSVVQALGMSNSSARGSD